MLLLMLLRVQVEGLACRWDLWLALLRSGALKITQFFTNYLALSSVWLSEFGNVVGRFELRFFHGLEDIHPLFGLAQYLLRVSCTRMPVLVARGLKFLVLGG